MCHFTVVDPADIPPIGVPSMDATHHEEVELVNQIGRLIKTDQSGAQSPVAQSLAAQGNKILHAKLDEWVEHTQAHFARENQLMEATSFPAYGPHSMEHTQALDGLKAVIDAWQTEKKLDALADYVFVRWPQWFQMHVSSMDSVTAAYLSQRGVE